MSNYSENILQAVDMVVTERLKDINFDKTIIGKVVKANKDGSYTISYEAMTLLAYPSGSEEYDEGSQVYVLIPQGDYNLRKIITGRVGAKEIANYLYLNPGKQLVPIELYNGNNTNGIDINLRDFSNESTDLPTIKYLYFSADFKTKPGENNDMKEYGIKIEGKGYFKEPKGEQKPDEDFVWTFMSSQFQGNPYMFNGWFKQEYLFDIEQYNKIEGLQIKYIEDTLFEIQNIQLATGYAVESAPSSMKTGKIVLYEETAKEKYPTPEQKDTMPSDVFQDFKLQTKFFLNNQLIDTTLKNSDEYPQYAYKWFIYNKEALDMGNGKHWGLLVTDADGTNEYSDSSLELKADISTKSIKLNNEKITNVTIPNTKEKALQVAVQVYKIDKVMKEENGIYTRLLNNPKDLYGQTVYKDASEKYNNTVKFINQQNTWPWTYNKADTDNYYLTDGEEYTTKEIALKEALNQYNKALCNIVAEEKIATSNILPLLRSDQKTIEDALKGSGVELTAADDGTYFIYDGTTNLVDKELKKNKTFRITAKLTGAAKWTTGQTLRWKIPKKGTMIAAPNPTKYNTKDTMELDPNKAFLTEDDKWYIIEDTVVADTNPILDFDISDIYDPAATMNVIRCEVGEIDSHIEQYIQGLQEDYQKLFDEYLELIDMGQTEEDETLKTLKEQLNKAQINFMDEWAKSTQKNMVEQVGSGILLTFGINGSQGTEYTVGISFDKTCITPGGVLRAMAHLYNPAGQDITDDVKDKFVWRVSQRGYNIVTGEDGEVSYETISLSSGTKITAVDNYYTKNDEGEYVRIDEETVVPEENVPQYYSPIISYSGEEVELHASSDFTGADNYFALLNLHLNYQDINILQGKNFEFETFKTIPLWTGDPKIIPDFTGPTTIVYDSQSGNPQYIKSKYSLNGADQEINVSSVGDNLDNYGIVLSNETKTLLMPQMITTKPPKITVKLSAAAGEWYQPLAIYRNEYTSAILNSWGGEQIINEGENKILTKMIGAGVKDSNNRFSGVFMGAVGKDIAGSDTKTGLYGYQSGQQRFKFTEDGEAYIGTGADNFIGFGYNEKEHKNELVVKTKSFTLNTDKIYLSDTANNEGELVNIGNGAIKVKNTGLVEIGGDNRDWTEPVQYAGNDNLKLIPMDTEDETKWYSSSEAFVKPGVLNNWSDQYLYLWERIPQQQANSYKYTQQISANSEILMQYRANGKDSWDDSQDVKNDKYYRKIRRHKKTGAIDVLEGPIQIPEGQEGASGVGIDSVINYYAATTTANADDITDGLWKATIAETNFDDTNKYLWNKEEIAYTNDSTTTTTPAIISVYSKDGKGISEIVEEYAVNNDKETSPTEWSTTPPELNTDNQYLWNRETIKYTDGSENTTEPVIIGIYGKGEDGTSPFTISFDNDFELIPKIDGYLEKREIIITPTFWIGNIAQEVNDSAIDFSQTSTGELSDTLKFEAGKLKITLNEHTVGNTITITWNGVSKSFIYKLSIDRNEYKLTSNPTIAGESTYQTINCQIKINGEFQAWTSKYDSDNKPSAYGFTFNNINYWFYYRTKQGTSIYTTGIKIDNNNSNNLVISDLQQEDYPLTLYLKNQRDGDVEIETVELVKDGAPGASGNDGVSVHKSYKHYLLSTNSVWSDIVGTDNVPTDPDSWTDDYDQVINEYLGKSNKSSYRIWSQDVTEYDNDTTSYSIPTSRNADSMVGEWMTKDDATVKINGASIAANSINVNSLVVNEDFNVKIMNANYSNLLINSNIPITNKNYLINTYTMTENFKTNTKYTVTIKGQLGTDSDNFGLFTTNGEWLIDSGIKFDSINNLYKGTFTTSLTISSSNGLRVYARPNSAKAEETTIEWIVLKEGDLDVATKWSPSSLDINAENIITSINADESGVTISGDKVQLTGNNLIFNAENNLSISSTNFTVSNDGTVTAKKGQIAGWNIGNTTLYGAYYPNGTQSKKRYQLNLETNADDWICAYNYDQNGNYTTPFCVTREGILKCQGAEIEGTLKAGSILSIGNTRNPIRIVSDDNDGYDRFLTAKYLEGTTPGIGLSCENGTSTFAQLWIGKIYKGTKEHWGMRLACTSGTEYFLTDQIFQHPQGLAPSSGATNSDIKLKNTINTLSLKYSILFDNLRPVTYKYNDGTSGRLHTGFIAQQVKDALDIANISSKDFAGLVIFDQGTDEEKWTLRYEEFIALNTSEIQKLKTRVSELEIELAEIKEKLK